MRTVILIISFINFFNSSSFSQGAGTLLSFDGLDDYVRVDNVSNYAAGISFTFEVWFKSDSGETFSTLFAFNQSNGNNRILIYNQLIFDLLNGQNRYYNNIPSYNEWNYLVVSLNTLSKLISVFINGERDITISTTNKVAASDLASIGQEWDPGLITSAHFKGLIDEVRISDRVLSLEEIRERMHLKIIAADTNLIGYWRFDEGVGTIAGDSSGKGNDGILINGPVWMQSTAPLGDGVAATRIVSSPGIIEFAGADLEINYSLISGIDTVVCSMISNYPEGLLPPDSSITNKYWILNKYGDGTFLADLTFTFDDSVFSQVDTVKLYSRESRSDGEWIMIALASNITANTANFSNISNFGQFAIYVIQGISGVEYKSDIPMSFELFNNYPNPFNPSTKISWQSPVGSHQTIKLFDLLGREIETIVDGYYDAGYHSTLYIINSALPSGVCFYQLRAGDPANGTSFIQTKKMLYLK